MMSATEILASYRRNLNEPITVRRYSGTGASRTAANSEVKGKAWGYTAAEIVGSIIQGDERVLVIADDLEAAGFSLPVKTSDKVVIGDKEKAIISPGQRKAPDGTLIAYELQVRG